MLFLPLVPFLIWLFYKTVIKSIIWEVNRQKQLRILAAKNRIRSEDDDEDEEERIDWLEALENGEFDADEKDN